MKRGRDAFPENADLLLKRAAEWSGSPLRQSRKNPLAQEWKRSTAIHHALHELECMDLSLDDSSAPWFSEARQDSIFLVWETSDNALPLRTLAGSPLAEPHIQALALTATKHLQTILSASRRSVGRRTGLAHGQECFLLLLLEI